MQERYCTCGARIMVQFSKRGANWQPIFWGLQHFCGARLHICPSCGQSLNINKLR